jgi:hypothetical protein
LGIRRLGSPQRGFDYRLPEDQRVGRRQRERIDDLKIPPA